jgi:hypothetical protein
MPHVILIYLLTLSAGFAADPAPIEHPLPFSHKQHSTLGLKCQECHANAGAGEHMGFPATNTCMARHVLIQKDRPAIKRWLNTQNQKNRFHGSVSTSYRIMCFSVMVCT